MKISAWLNLNLTLDNQGDSSFYPSINNLALFKKILALGYSDYWLRPTYENNTALGGRVKIIEPIGSGRLASVVELLDTEAGLTPLPTSYVPPQLTHKHYTIRYTRDYAKADLDAAPFLRIQASGTVYIGEGETQREDESYIVRYDAKQKSRRVFGVLYPFFCYGVAEPLKSLLESAGLKGLTYEPIEILPAHKAIKPLWKITSPNRLPRCLLPWVQGNGLPFSGDYSLQAFIDDGGYFPPEFKYKRSDLAPFGVFDVAVTTERISVGGHFHHREVIVSQKFREVITKLKVPGIDFVPVRLVD